MKKKKNKHSYHLYLILLWCIISTSMQAQGQATTALNFDCECPGTSVSFDPESVVLCQDGSIDLSTILNIDPLSNAKSIGWLNEGAAPSSGIAETPGRYTVKVEDQTGCISKASIEVLDPEDYFKDNCFIAIPIGEYTLAPIVGLNGTVSQSRSRMEGLTITFPKKDEEDENEEIISLDISSIPNDGTSVLVSDSENCTNLSGNIAEYEKGDQILAHVDAESNVLYLGSSAMLDNESGQQIVDDYLRLWSETTGSDILSAPISYTCGGEQFLETMAFDHWWELAQLFLNCENFDAEAGGVVPKCFWECYKGTPLFPFMSGMVDGGAKLVTETATLIEGVLDFSNLLASYLICSSIQLDADFYKRIEERTTTPSDDIRKWIDSKTGIMGLDCDKTHQGLDKIGEEIGNVTQVITNLSFEQIGAGLAKIQEEISKYLEKLSTCTNLKTCNIAAYEQGKLILNFASLFVAPEAAVPFLSGLLNGAGKYADDLLEFIQDMIKYPDILNKDIKRLIAEDPEWAKDWNELRKLRVCPGDLVGYSNSRSSAPCKYRELLKIMYSNGSGFPQLKRLTKQLKKDDIYNPSLFDALADNTKLLEPYRALWLGAGSKTWVRTNVPLLERVIEKGLDDKQTEKLAQMYKNLKLDKTRKGDPPTFAEKELNLPNPPFDNLIKVEYDEFGFPKFEQFIPGATKSDYVFGKNDYPDGFSTLKGNGVEFKHANNKVAEKFGCQENKPCLNDNFNWDGSSPNFSVKQGDEWVKYTWHHHQDGKTMFPIPTKINNFRDGGFLHSGGGAIIDRELIGFFDGPDFGN